MRALADIYAHPKRACTMVYIFNAREKLLVVEQDEMSVRDVESIRMVLSAMHDASTDELLRGFVGVAQGYLVGFECGRPTPELVNAVHHTLARYRAVETPPDKLGI